MHLGAKYYNQPSLYYNNPATSMPSKSPPPSINQTQATSSNYNTTVDAKWEALASSTESRTNYCWKVVEEMFTLEELIGHCVHGGGPLKKPHLDKEKMLLVRGNVLYWKPVTQKETVHDAWRACTKNIDAYLRKPKYNGK